MSVELGSRSGSSSTDSFTSETRYFLDESSPDNHNHNHNRNHNRKNKDTNMGMRATTTTAAVDAGDGERVEAVSGIVSEHEHGIGGSMGGLKAYCCSMKSVELILYTIFGLFLAGIPYLFPIHERPIPYQVTAAGDVILDFSLNNPKVEKQTFPEVQAGIYTVIIPLVTQLCVALFIKKNPSHAHYTWCAYAMGLGSTLCITEALKRYVGRLRPNTYDYCEFDIDTLQCTQNDNLNWRTSFPSGHSSTAFCGCTLLTWYLCYCVVINLPFAQQQFTMRRKLLAFVVLSPMLLAYVVSASRIADNYHFVGDVLAGAMIGFVNAIVFSRIHFPDLYMSRFALRRINDESDAV